MIVFWKRMRVRLIRKLAERIDGVDLRHVSVGDVIDVSPREAELLLAEGWAVAQPADAGDRGDSHARRTPPGPFAVTAEAYHRVRRYAEPERHGSRHRAVVRPAQRRRIEDVVRDELRDWRAKVIGPSARFAFDATE